MKISRKWTIIFFYPIAIFVITPYLPQLIQTASSRWSSAGVSRFVLVIEIAIALIISILAVGWRIQFLLEPRWGSFFGLHWASS